MTKADEFKNMVKKNSKKKPCGIYEFTYRLASKGFEAKDIFVIVNELYRDKTKYE